MYIHYVVYSVFIILNCKNSGRVVGDICKIIIGIGKMCSDKIKIFKISDEIGG
jgi:hypothetical protein